MKVLHVIPAVAKRHGGPTQAVFGMCRALEREGVESLIATTDADGPGGRLPVELGRPVKYEGVSVIFFPRQWSEAFKYSEPLARWLKAHVSDFDLVDIHAIFSHSSLAASWACLKRRIPYIIRPIGSLDPWSLRQKGLRKRLLWFWGVRRMLERANAIHYTTEEERRLAEETLGLDRGVVIPLGVEEELFQKDSPPLGGAPYVLILSRLHPKKGLEEFLKAFLDIVQKKEFREWKLLIAGEGEASYGARLKSVAKSHSENGTVLFAGWLEGEQKARALRGASLLVLPSYQENFGLAVAEAMACGVPVLVSQRVNLAKEIERARAGWVVELDEASLRQGLLEALGNEKERRLRGRCGLELANRCFRWPVVAQELVTCYHRLLSS